MAKAKSRSTSLPEDLDLRVRTIALRENRTPANVLENAVRVSHCYLRTSGIFDREFG